jgi:hypothetical protein
LINNDVFGSDHCPVELHLMLKWKTIYLSHLFVVLKIYFILFTKIATDLSVYEQ